MLKINPYHIFCFTILLFAGLNANAADLESGPYVSNPTLESSDSVGSDKEVFFGATGSIVLKPGFTVKPGGLFVARIGDFTGLTLTTDSDADGYADWWELTHYGNLTYLPDVLPPVITLIGNSTITIFRLDPYNDPGATANDIHEGDLTSHIAVDNQVDNTVAGSYTVKYDVADSSGNQAITVVRTVIVAPNDCDLDATPPAITLNGDGTVTVEIGGSYSEQGATAVDNCDGDLTAAIVIGGSVDTGTAGAYTLTYNVTDSKGNQAPPVYRTVVVLGCDDSVQIDTTYQYDDGGRLKQIKKQVY